MTQTDNPVLLALTQANSLIPEQKPHGHKAFVMSAGEAEVFLMSHLHKDV